MAQGDSKVISVNVGKNAIDGDYNGATDVWAWALVTDTYASIDANAASLGFAGLTAVAAGGNYAGKTTLAGVAVTDEGGGVTKVTYTSPTFAAHASNPTTAKCFVVMNDTSAGDDIIKVTDITTDGTTAAVMTDKSFTMTVAAGGAFTYTANA